MHQYIRLLEELGLLVTETHQSKMSGFWFIRAMDEDGVEYAWAVDPTLGPIAEDPYDENIPLQAYTAWEVL